MAYIHLALDVQRWDCCPEAFLAAGIKNPYINHLGIVAQRIKCFSEAVRQHDNMENMWVRHNPYPKPKGFDGAFHEVQPQDDEAIITKTGFNALASKELAGCLERADAEKIIITGFQLGICVRATALACLEEYDVIIVPELVGLAEPARSKFSKALRELKDAGCNITNLQDMERSLGLQTGIERNDIDDLLFSGFSSPPKYGSAACAPPAPLP